MNSNKRGLEKDNFCFILYLSRHLLENNNLWRSGCNVCTKDPENFDEEVKSLVTACRKDS